jgi:hypothetical protein
MSNSSRFIKLVLVVPVALTIATFASVITGELLDDYYTVGPWGVNVVKGDKDGFGLGLAEGDFRPAGSSTFDERELSDPFFTDVWPVPFTEPRAFSYSQTFAPPPGPFNAKLKLFTLGIQDGDSQVQNSDTDIKLYADGLEVPYAFDNVDQFYQEEGVGWVESAGYVVTEIPEDIAHVLLDGAVEFTYEVLQLGSHKGSDSFAIDYSELIIEPTTAGRVDILANTVAALDLAAGLEKAMSATLKEVTALLEDHNPDNDGAAINKLLAFLNKVDAKTGKDISESDADFLAGQVLDIISALANDERCPCWGYSDIYSLPTDGETAACVSDSYQSFYIEQVSTCEHSYGVTINHSDDSLHCVVNRFDCPGFFDLGNEIETNESEFAACLDQILTRCEDLGIDPPDFP